MRSIFQKAALDRLRGTILVAGALMGMTRATDLAAQTYIVRFRADQPSIRKEVAYPVERVRAAMPAALQAMGLPGGQVAGSDDEFMTPYLRARGRLFSRPLRLFLDCGADNFGFTLGPGTEVTLAMVTRLEVGPEGSTLLLSQLDAYAVNANTSPDPTYCGSKGVIEDLLAATLQRLLDEQPGG